ncbi:MAG: hypothetical protein ACLVJ6_12265 [Merdibacter sp.]
MLNAAIIIALTSWPSNARMMRAGDVAQGADGCEKRRPRRVEGAHPVPLHRSQRHYPIIANTTMNVA